jgi:hypothetical protein
VAPDIAEVPSKGRRKGTDTSPASLTTNSQTGASSKKDKSQIGSSGNQLAFRVPSIELVLIEPVQETLRL